jgi:DNA ligase-1
MLICLSRSFSLTAPLDAEWSVDPSIPTLSKDARTAVFKRAEEIVKQAFARQPSYDDLVPALLKLGVEKLATECTMRIGLPIKPMLGNITKDLNDMAKILEGRAFACEYKYPFPSLPPLFIQTNYRYDGQRAQIHLSTTGKVSIFSRHLELMTEKYPDLVALIPHIQATGTQSFIMEGEVVAVDESGSVKTFQTLSGRGKKNVDLRQVKVKVCLYAFDLMYLNGEVISLDN